MSCFKYIYLAITSMFATFPVTYCRSDVYLATDGECQNISPQGVNLTWGKCSENSVLLRLSSISLIDCATDCLSTSQCGSINYRPSWKMCDLLRSTKKVNLADEPGCIHSEVSSWSKSVVGTCLTESCPAGKVCRYNEATQTTLCDDAYCTATVPYIPNSKIAEKFGLYRNINCGTVHVCNDGYMMCGTPLLICRHGNEWEVPFFCLPNRDRKNEVFMGKCYRFSDSKKNWRDAQADCEAGKMSLVTIHSESKNNWIERKLMKMHKAVEVWIGGKRTRSGDFVWIDGTGKVSALPYTNWYTGEPSNSGNTEDCIQMGLNGKWNDITCKVVIHYVCEQV